MSFFRDSQGNIYYNIEVANKSNDDEINLYYRDSRSQAIIPNANDYELSILRFQIDMSNVPLMIFPTTEFETFKQPPYSTVDNSFWSITIEKSGAGSNRKNLEYFTYGRERPFIYSFAHFCDILNIAIRQATDAMAVSDKVPYFTYDKTRGAIDLIAPAEYRFSAIDRKIFVNKNLYNAFARDFPGIIRDANNGRYYELLVYPDGQNSLTSEIVDAGATAINPVAAPSYKMSTYFPNLGNLVAPKAIVFTSSQIPAKPEFISDNVNISGDTSNSFIHTLKDFELSLDGIDATLVRGKQNFSIASEFQYTSLEGGGDGIKNIDLQGFWKDQHGRLTPLTIPAGSSFSMKMLFKRF